MTPSSGPVGGGTVVTIRGAGFTHVTRVRFGTANARFSVTNAGSISASSPAASIAGTIDVTVGTSGGVSARTKSDQFTYLVLVAPRVSGITPASGAPTGLTVVTIHGSGFSQASTVRFGKVQTHSFVVKSDQEIVAASPPGTVGKVVDVTVVSPLGVSLPVATSRFSYRTHGGEPQPFPSTGPRLAGPAASFVHASTTSGIPTISGLSPNQGDPSGGTLVTIFGSGFLTATGVGFGTTSCVQFFIEGDDRITALSPPGALGTVDVTVTSLTGASPTGVADHFTYASVAVGRPEIYGVTPNHGSAVGGTSVTIFGKGFASATQVKFGSVAQDFAGRGIFQNDTQIVVTAPAQGSSPALVDITIVSPAGSSSPTTADQFTYTAPALPTIDAIDPNHGPSQGLVPVTIRGSGFTGATSVMFGNASAANLFVEADDVLFVSAPLQGSNPSRVDVRVTTPVGTSAISNAGAFTFSALGPPRVDGLDINRGSANGGTQVLVVGSGFMGATSVKLGTATAAFTVFDDNNLLLTSPPGTAGQTVDVTVTTPGGSSGIGVADQFTYSAPAQPVIYGISPNHGFPSGLQPITIYGAGFLGTTAVAFSGASATGIRVLDDGTISVTSPAKGTNPTTVDVAVTAPGGVSATTVADQFTYVTPGLPAIYAVSPNRGPSLGGTSVTIFGAGFQNGSPTVSFGGVAATGVFVSSDSQMFATSPAGATGTTVDVVVTTPSGPNAPSINDKFTYYTAPAPTVTAVSPNSGPAAGGTTVFITGSGFRALDSGSVSAVEFGPNHANSFSILADNVIRAISPAGTVGTVHITVTGPAGASPNGAADSFTYDSSVPAAPVVTGIGPNSGPAGATTIYVSGQGFTAASKVLFGTVIAGFSVIDDGLIQVFGAPAGTAGPVDVTVTGPGGTSSTSGADTFTYTSTPIPTVTVVSPGAGPPAGGTTVYITGTDLHNVQAVNFGSAPPTFASTYSDSLISATSPAGADGATVDVTVKTASGTSATNANDKFTWSSTTPPPSGPTVNGISPNVGRTTGFNSLTIFGSGFSGATAVKFGTVSANSFYSAGDTQIIATAPPGTAGTVDVTVTAGTTTSATSTADRYTYVPPGPPAVGAVDTNRGTSFGGTNVIIRGRGLTGATVVRFGTVPATRVFASSDDQIFATSPAGTSGATVDVTVTTEVGTSPAVSADLFTYVTPARPVVDAIAPSTGLASGSAFADVIIYGRNLTGTSQVLFGSVAAPATAFGGTDTQVDVASPPEPAGTVSVTVTTPGGTSATSAAGTFTYVNAPVPVVTALGPSSGISTGLNAVFITGTGLSAARSFGFQSLSAVSFGNACAPNFMSLNDDLIEVFGAPPGTPNSTVDVTVRTLGGTSAATPADKYTYTTEPLPVVSVVNPTAGPAAGSTVVYVTGANFRNASAVNFGTVSQPISYQTDDNLIVAFSPAGTPGATVDVTVTAPAGTSATVSADQYTYGASPPAPAVTAVSPNSGISAGGTNVFITGSGFMSATSVSFGGTAVARLFDCGLRGGGPGPIACGWFAFSDTLIEVVSPPATAGIVDVTVGNLAGTSTTSNADKFTYTATPAPVVSAVSPNSGPSGGGTAVFISGSNFLLSGDAPPTVKFGSSAATAALFSDDLLLVGSAPVQGSNPATVDVTVTTVGGASASSAADRFTYTATPVPVITAVNPTSGPAGATVYVTGTGLRSVQTVMFATFQAAAKSVGVISDTLVVASSPPGPAAGSTIDITATSTGGTSAIVTADHFRYTAGPVPTVTVVSPAGGPAAGGTMVSVTGTALGSATTVSFGTTPASNFTVISDTLIQVASPAGIGNVDVTITTAGGTSATSSADKFLYNGSPPKPVVTKLIPTSGPAFGGTSVKITGAYFVGVTAVKFGTTAAASFTVNSDALITAITPAGTGTVDVTVSTSSGTSATSNADKFAFITPPVPAVTGLLPASGPAAGGTVVTITGTGFTGATSVKFGTIPSASRTVNSDTQITATSPAGSGIVDVTVTTPGGTSATASADQFTYLAAPAITNVTPNIGPTAGGTTVTITGTTLGGAVVHFGTVMASITTNTGTQITVTSPAGTAPGVVNVTVTTAGGTSAITPADQFNYGDSVTAGSPGQFQLGGNDGTTWKDMDPNGGLSLTISPSTNSMAILTGNADLWTAKAGVNQDIGIYVAESDLATYPGHIVAWKESGGFAGTYSPNAAAVQTVFPMTVGLTYHIKLQWKTNRATDGTIVVGAGPWPATSPTYSPTTLTARLATASQVSSAVSTQQYVKTGSDGATWVDIDSTSGTPLTTTIMPTVDSLAVLSGNVDLWTAKAGVNQDVGINVAESDTTKYPGNIVAWKESGGFAGTYSPNAAFVQTVFPMSANVTYHLKLQWKTNKGTDGTIVAGAGPWPSNVPVYSPTRLTVQLMPASALISRVSNRQYQLASSDGAHWSDMDTTSTTPLSLTVQPTANCTAIISGNADLWTTQATYNQDIAISVSPSSATGNIVAWKESGGFAGTFSPNAAFVQATVSLSANTLYTIKLQWKTNKPQSNGAVIIVGAGPWPSNVPVYSPTTLTAQLFGCG